MHINRIENFLKLVLSLTRVEDELFDYEQYSQINFH